MKLQLKFDEKPLLCGQIHTQKSTIKALEHIANKVRKVIWKLNKIAKVTRKARPKFP